MSAHLANKSVLFITPSGVLRSLHSFPTRRSSDLAGSSSNRSSRSRRSASPSGRVSRIARTLSSTVSLRNTDGSRSEEHTSELQSHSDLVCRLLLEKKKKKKKNLALRYIHTQPPQQ